MNQIKIAIIGCGAVAEMYHLPTLISMPEFKVEYLVDKSKERLIFLKNKFKLDCKITLDYREVLSNPDVEAVFILTPPNLHRQMVIDSAEGGKHIFCEKPFAMNTKEAKEMINCSISNDICIMVGFNFRFIPSYKKLKSLIEGGFFGTIIGGHSTMFANAFAWPSISKFQYKKGEGGGALFEMGTHHIDLMNWFFGDAELVYADIKNLISNNIDDTASIYIKYKNGANCISHIGWNNLSINTVSIAGLDGYATASANKKEVVYYRKDLTGQQPIRLKVDGKVSAYHSELLHFFRMINNHALPIISTDEIINSVRTVEVAYESNLKNAFLKIGE